MSDLTIRRPRVVSELTSASDAVEQVDRFQARRKMIEQTRAGGWALFDAAVGVLDAQIAAGQWFRMDPDYYNGRRKITSPDNGEVILPDYRRIHEWMQLADLADHRNSYVQTQRDAYTNDPDNVRRHLATVEGFLRYFADPSGQLLDDWYTPRWLFDQLDVVFDVDVCAPASPAYRTVPARRFYTSEDDGLAQPWEGLIWCNPPYSTPSPWIDRWVEHDNGLLLTHVSVGATRMPKLWHAADRIVFFSGMWFERPDGTTQKPYWMLQLAARGSCAELLGRVDYEHASPAWRP